MCTPNQTILVKIGESLRTPDLSSFCDFCPGRCGDSAEGLYVLGKASWPTRLVLSHRNHCEMDWATCSGVHDQGRSHDKCAGYCRGWTTAELGSVHWGVSLQPPKTSIKGLNSECWVPLAFLGKMENGKGSHFTSGYDKSERQLDAKQELNREPHETLWTSGYLGGYRRVSSPPLTTRLWQKNEAGSETLMKTSSSKRDTEGLCSEFVAVTWASPLCHQESRIAPDRLKEHKSHRGPQLVAGRGDRMSTQRYSQKRAPQARPQTCW